MRTRYAVLALCALAAVTAISAQSGQARSGARLEVTSTLDGTGVLPHRIRWQAKTNVSPAGISEVDFLIDGKLRWVEHKAPYVYGSDGDWLVTSFLTPGAHRFEVRAKATDGRSAIDVHAARVSKQGLLPMNIAGAWQRKIPATQAGTDLAGIWRLRIGPVGWSIVDPKGDPSLIDVAYLSSDLLESRSPIWTKPPGPAGSPTSGNGWCDAPFAPVRYRFSAAGATLTLQLVGTDRCGGEHFIWAGTWSRSR
jgi:hypothetical protein